MEALTPILSSVLFLTTILLINHRVGQVLEAKKNAQNDVLDAQMADLEARLQKQVVDLRTKVSSLEMKAGFTNE